ncbi:hypothetical protein XPA_010750 [Xanthoria parietina]
MSDQLQSIRPGCKQPLNTTQNFWLVWRARSILGLASQTCSNRNNLEFVTEGFGAAERGRGGKLVLSVWLLLYRCQCVWVLRTPRARGTRGQLTARPAKVPSGVGLATATKVLAMREMMAVLKCIAKGLLSFRLDI